MNFKPTKLKAIVSVIVFVIVDLFLAKSVICMTAGFQAGGCPPWYNFALDSLFIAISFVSAVIVYLVWSLVQKK